MADGSRRYVAFVKETVAGETPVTPVMQALRLTGGDSLNNARTNISSDEIRSDRQIIVSRLGQNAPEISVPFELSFESYDDLLAGAMGSEWIGDYSLTLTVDVDGATLTTDDLSNWADKGVAEGDWIVISGLTVGSEDGIYYVDDVTTSVLTLTDPDQLTPAVLTTEADATLTIVGGFTGGQIDASANNITVSATNKTITAGSSAGWNATFRLTEGDAVYFAGFAQATNNGWKTLTGVSDTVLTVSDTLANETLAAGTLDFSSSSALLTTGITLPTFTLEEGFEDVSEYHNTKGAKINSMNISIAPDSVITGSLDFIGQKYSPFSAQWQTPGTPGTGASIASSVTDGNTNDVFDSYTGSFIFDGVDVDQNAAVLITSLDFTLANDVGRRYAILDRDAKSLYQGRITCTGSVSAYFPNAFLSAKFDNETEFEMRVRLEDLDGNSYLFGWPKTKFTSDTKSVSETDVTLSMDVIMLGGDAFYNTMYIKKQPKAS